MPTELIHTVNDRMHPRRGGREKKGEREKEERDVLKSNISAERKSSHSVGVKACSD